jgi:hypothetical protein
MRRASKVLIHLPGLNSHRLQAVAVELVTRIQLFVPGDGDARVCPAGVGYGPLAVLRVLIKLARIDDNGEWDGSSTFIPMGSAGAIPTRYPVFNAR